MIKNISTLITLLLASSVALQADSPRITINGKDIRTLGDRGDLIVYKAEDRADGIECSSNGRDISIKSLWIYPKAKPYMPICYGPQPMVLEPNDTTDLEKAVVEPSIYCKGGSMPAEIKGGPSLILHSSSLALANQMLASSFELVIGAPKSILKFHNVDFKSPNIYFIGNDFSFSNCYLLSPELVQFESAVESALFQSVSVKYDPSSNGTCMIDGAFDGETGKTPISFQFYGAKEIRILFNDFVFEGTPYQRKICRR